MKKYVISIDQSTQGTKALLFEENGTLVCRTDKSHRQLIDDKGWVEHDLEEIYANTILALSDMVKAQPKPASAKQAAPKQSSPKQAAPKQAAPKPAKAGKAKLI